MLLYKDSTHVINQQQPMLTAILTNESTLEIRERRVSDGQAMIAGSLLKVRISIIAEPLVDDAHNIPFVGVLVLLDSS